MSFNLKTVQTTPVAGAAIDIAPAKAGYRVVVLGIVLASVGSIIQSGGATALTGVLPTCNIAAIDQRGFLLRGNPGEKLNILGTGTGFIMWAYEQVPVQNPSGF